MSGFFNDIPGHVIFVFILCFILLVLAFGKAFFTSVSNLGQTVITREAGIVGKRQRTSVAGGTNHMPVTSRTSYFVTFQFNDGSREELSVSPTDYGLLVEGDAGTLRSQGTWFKGFDRSRAY